MSACYGFLLDFWTYNPACTKDRLDKAVTKGYITQNEETQILATTRQVNA